MSRRFLAPSALGEQVYQAQRARRYPPVNGIPDPRATYKVEADRETLRRLAKLAFAAHLDAVAPPADHARVATLLLADVDARVDRDEMVVLARHGFTSRRAVMSVEIAHGPPVRFPLLDEWRDIPSNTYAMDFVTEEALAGGRKTIVPPATRPLFDAIEAAHAIRLTEFEDAGWWPMRFKHQHKRLPTWGEIEAAWPRIGAWMAKMRVG